MPTKTTEREILWKELIKKRDEVILHLHNEGESDTTIAEILSITPNQVLSVRSIAKKD